MPGKHHHHHPEMGGATPGEAEAMPSFPPTQSTASQAPKSSLAS